QILHTNFSHCVPPRGVQPPPRPFRPAPSGSRRTPAPGRDVCDRDPKAACASPLLPLAELEPLARARAPVLLALLHARVAGEHSLASELSTQGLVLAHERAGDREP